MPEWLYFLGPLAAFPLGFAASRLPSRGWRLTGFGLILLLPLIGCLGVLLSAGPMTVDQFAFLIGLGSIILAIPMFIWLVAGSIGYGVGRQTSRRIR